MRRREFIALLGGAAAWPFATRAQPGRVPTVGFLGASTLSAWSLWTAAFVQRLRELGWIDGRTIAIEYRWAEGRSERYTEIGTEFVRLKVDVIVTVGTAVPALKQLTSVIPIVFAAAVDPVGSGLVASLARPGGNITGLSNQTADIAGKRVELLRELVGQVRRLAIMVKSDNASAASEMREVKAAAGTLGIQVVILEIAQAEDIGPAFEKVKGQADALYVVIDSLVTTHANRIIRGWSLILCRELRGLVPAGCRVYRQDIARDQACRNPGRAADQVRSGH